jgi:phage shock protein PspC (stress-responsive transcriptional regulator)
MNKVLNINLGGVAFTIDDAAYSHLENYLQSLHNHFRESEGYEEIMSDIEARLGELLHEGIGKRSIVNIQDVKNAVSIMGKPEDFGAQPIADSQSSNPNSQSSTAQSSKNTEGGKSSQTAAGAGIKTGKRLFRDGQNKSVGGVCAGLAAYFGIEEVTWLRLFFVLLLIFTGVGGVLYIILWAVMPEAQTTADRLAMKGEPIDVNSIAKSVEEGFENFSKSVNEFGKPENQEKFSNQMTEGMNQVGNVLGGAIRGIGRAFGALSGVVKIAAIVVASLMIVALVFGWVMLIFGTVTAKPFVGYVTDNTMMTQIGALNAFVIFAVPIFAIILFLRRLIFKRDVANGWHIGLWTAFAASVFSLASIGGNLTGDFRHSGSEIQRIALPNDLQTVTIVGAPSQYGDIKTEVFDVKVSDEYLLSDDIHLTIEKSETNDFELVTKREADGETSTEARELARKIDFTPTLKDGVLTIPANFIIPRGTKWRDQQVHMTLKVPVGKIVRYDDEMAHHPISWVERDTKDDYEDDCYGDNTRVWLMTNKGCICVAEERDRTKKKVETED